MARKPYPGERPKDRQYDDGGSDTPPKKRGCGVWVLLALGVFFGLVVIAAIFGPSEEERAALEAERAVRDAEDAERGATAAEQADIDRLNAAVAMSASRLWEVYQENEVAARQMIGDRELLISGTISSVTLDFMDEPVVSLATPNQFMSVQLDFDDEDAGAVAGLRAGQEVEAICAEVTEVAGTPMLDDCELR